ncbi:ribonuclease H-like YkuK family protein [Calorimonas adulescens]|uniref:DUF458 domain-containing protein n=1 Tax=Calorimonas adulescens TaxID=2606906 RepID=A0A5D8QDY6_9THEO|nr:ribonuclease H-like YkuK family protein [Calorimonas adulescens]TZE81723.1 hypothetical protein FWJ32_08290 [Calorimonas adulescens]
MNFINPTKGKMDLDSMSRDIIEFMAEDTKSKYTLMIGTDSQLGRMVCFVTAIIIYRNGKGGRFYYRRFFNKRIPSLKQRIFMETSFSLEMANMLVERLDINGMNNLDVEIHMDVGNNGKTKEIIKEVVNLVIGSGYMAKVKPDSCGASKVADKYTKYAM